MKSGIYKITCNKTGRQYVGQSVSIPDRWLAHRSRLKRRVHPNQYLQRVHDKYGASNLTYEVLEICEPEVLLERESYYIAELKTSIRNGGFNLAEAGPSRLGIVHTDEAKEKISKSKRVEIVTQGLSLTMKEWVEKTGIPASTIRSRQRYGQSFEEAISKPKHPRFKV